MLRDVFETRSEHTGKGTLIHRIKRRLLAKPFLAFDEYGAYTVYWLWRNGIIEVVDCGISSPGASIEVPKSTTLVRACQREDGIGGV